MEKHGDRAAGSCHISVLVKCRHRCLNTSAGKSFSFCLTIVQPGLVFSDDFLGKHLLFVVHQYDNSLPTVAVGAADKADGFIFYHGLYAVCGQKSLYQFCLPKVASEYFDQ